MFPTLSSKVLSTLSSLLTRITQTAPPGLRDRIIAQGEAVKISIGLSLEILIEGLRNVVSWEQMGVTRGLEERMKGEDGMGGGYAKAKEERGKGCVARSKVSLTSFSFHLHILVHYPSFRAHHLLTCY